jgi:hypothetical protein
MPWIESHTLLIGHRKVVGCARELRIKPVYLVGHLHAFWHTVLEQCEDGDITSWDLRFIAEAASWTGDPERFFHALTNSGRPWIDLIPNRELPGVPGKLVHDWLDSAGRYLDSRYRTADPARLCTIWKKHGREYRLNKTQIARIQELSLPTDFPPDPDNPDKITQSVGTRTRTPARTDQNLDSENPGTGDIALHSNQGVGGVPTVAQVAEYISEIKAKDPKAYLNVNPQDEAHAICDKALQANLGRTSRSFAQMADRDRTATHPATTCDDRHPNRNPSPRRCPLPRRMSHSPDFPRMTGLNSWSTGTVSKPSARSSPR